MENQLDEKTQAFIAAAITAALAIKAIGTPHEASPNEGKAIIQSFCAAYDDYVMEKKGVTLN